MLNNMKYIAVWVTPNFLVGANHELHEYQTKVDKNSAVHLAGVEGVIMGNSQSIGKSEF